MKSPSDSVEADTTKRQNWSTARLQFKRLENETGKMSPRWFLGNAGIILAAGLFLVTALVLGRCLTQMLEHTRQAQNAQSALMASIALQESLDESSAVGRVYLVTHDHALLEVRARALRLVHEQTNRLSAIVRRDPTASRTMRELNSIIPSHLALLDKVIAASDGHGSATSLKGVEAQRIGLVRRANAGLAGLRVYEHAILEQQQDIIAENMRLASVLVLFAGLAAPLCGLIGIYLLRRERDNLRTHELQMELMHVQRLAIMGETAAMLAHEINQPLTAAANYLSVLRRHLESGAVEKATPIVERIGDQIQRTGTILRKLRRFIEKREAERSLESPEVLVEDAITLLGTIDNDVSLDTQIGPDLPRVMVDRVQLQQVLVNLMRNAIEAMQESPRRELSLSVFSPDRNTVEISLTDTGPGLPDAVRERLFLPFVTTKQSGMGVGLSICRSIIEQHNGRIWAEPNPRGGTVFRFTLPAVRERAVA